MTHSLAQPRRALILFSAIAALTVSSCGPDNREPTAPGFDPTLAVQGQARGLAKALEAQARHTDKLLKIEGVVGTGIGLRSDGQAEVQLYTKAAGVRGLPASLDGERVSVVVTGRDPGPACGGPRSGGHCRRRSQPHGQIRPPGAHRHLHRQPG